MIEHFIETEGINKGRIKDIDIAWEVAVTEDAWREEGNGKPMLSPPERIGKSEIHFYDLVEDYLKSLLTARMREEYEVIFEPRDRTNDLEYFDDDWTRYRIANTLFSAGHEYGIDYDTCTEVLAMPLEDAFEVAYDHLVIAGLDPDVVLADFMAPPAANV